MTVWRILLTSLIVAAPRVAMACPVCFGQSDAPMAKAVNMGIYVLLAVIGGVLVAFASFFIYLIRRARLFDDHGAPAAQEGIAQC